MRIHTAKDITELQKEYTKLILEEKGVERFSEHDGISKLHITVGKFDKVTPRTFRTHLRTILQTAKKYKIAKLAIELKDFSFPNLHDLGEAWLMNTVVENLLLADYEYTLYKSKKKPHALKEVLLCGKLSKESQQGFDRGMIVGTHTNMCRDMANTPGGDMTPALLAKEAQKAAKGAKIDVKILNKKEIEKLKMGALLGVGKGSMDEPKFIIMEYWGLGKPKKKTEETSKKRNSDKDNLSSSLSDNSIDKHNPIVFVGKGITFDTGGLQIKPGMSMYEMHMDMSGGASVIASIAAIAKLGLKQNVIGLIPAAENAVSGDSMRPGDVITSMSGKTIDVLHTDAEGRLVLADALHYARKYNPKLVIDIATLTGASLVALGQHAHAVMTKDRTLEDRLRELGEESGDYVFPLPLWDEYKQYTKGVHGDISNIPANDSKYGGAINGGAFLAHFTEGLTWAHIDMAPRMTSVSSDKLAKGATGEPTRLLVSIAEKIN